MHVNIPLLSSDLVSIGADQLCIDHSNIDALKYSLHALRIHNSNTLPEIRIS